MHKYLLQIIYGFTFKIINWWYNIKEKSNKINCIGVGFFFIFFYKYYWCWDRASWGPKYLIVIDQDTLSPLSTWVGGVMGRPNVNNTTVLF